MDAFLDSNIFLAYATDFEPNHPKSRRLFHGNYNRYSGIRVKAELSKIRRRRAKLYEELDIFLSQGNTIQNFRPQIHLKGNDQIHVTQLLNQLAAIPKNDLLRLFRKIIRIIELEIENAFGMVTKPLVPISGDLACESQIDMLIGNSSDAEILVDALCWAEKKHSSKITFCTTDYCDILNKRIQIYKRICEIRAYLPAEIPLEISSLDELIPN